MLKIRHISLASQVVKSVGRDLQRDIFTNEFVVNTYEIRILRKGGQAPDIFSGTHISDHAAVRRAHALAEEGDAVEVWRGTACVYALSATGNDARSAVADLQRDFGPAES